MLPVKRDFHIAHTAPFPRRGVFPVAHLSVDPSSKIKLNEDDTTFLQTSGETRPTIMRIGVLALQGDFDAHRRRLEELGAEVALVKKPEQLDDIDGLVIPGGESGTFLKLSLLLTACRRNSETGTSRTSGQIE